MKTLIHIFLDDQRRCPSGFVLARNAAECLALLEECEVGVASLDHDLGWGEPDGTELAKQIAERGLYPREIFLHSSSDAGRMSMYQVLCGAKPDGVRVHVFSMPFDVLEPYS